MSFIKIQGTNLPAPPFDAHGEIRPIKYFHTVIGHHRFVFALFQCDCNRRCPGVTCIIYKQVYL